MAYANQKKNSEQLEQEFPFWKRLHGFWRTLPNFNPHTASSEPGQDLAAEALALIHGRGQDNNNNGLGSQDDFYDEEAQNYANEEADSAMQEQVCHESHLCIM